MTEIMTTSQSDDRDHAGHTGGKGWGKAKSVIMVYLSGGLAHQDTFDPKPNAPAEVRGEFRTIPTALPGVRISEMLPRLARCMNRVALLRSLVGWADEHSSWQNLTGAVMGIAGALHAFYLTYIDPTQFTPILTAAALYWTFVNIIRLGFLKIDQYLNSHLISDEKQRQKVVVRPKVGLVSRSALVPVGAAVPAAREHAL